MSGVPLSCGRYTHLGCPSLVARDQQLLVFRRDLDGAGLHTSKVRHEDVLAKRRVAGQGLRGVTKQANKQTKQCMSFIGVIDTRSGITYQVSTTVVRTREPADKTQQNLFNTIHKKLQIHTSLCAVKYFSGDGRMVTCFMVFPLTPFTFCNKNKHGTRIQPRCFLSGALPTYHIASQHATITKNTRDIFGLSEAFFSPVSAANEPHTDTYPPTDHGKYFCRANLSKSPMGGTAYNMQKASHEQRRVAHPFTRFPPDALNISFTLAFTTGVREWKRPVVPIGGEKGGIHLPILRPSKTCSSF